MVKIGRYSGIAICVLTAVVLGLFALLQAGWSGAIDNPAQAREFELLAIGPAVAAGSFLVGAWGIWFWLGWTRYSTLVTCCLVAPVYFYILLVGYNYDPFYDLSSSLGVLLVLGMILLAVWLCLPAVREEFKNGELTV